jgi:hypothetical protein
MASDAAAGTGGHGSPRSDVRRKAIWVVVAVVAVLLAWIFGAYVVPRWWAQRLGNFVDGRLTVGSVTGLALGAVFTLVPLLVLWAGIRFRRSWKRALVFVLAAVLLASPVLVIGTIVWGNGNAAHAGERILDVDGPGVRGGAVVGVVIGIVAFAGILYLVVSRGANKRKAKRYRDELRDQEHAAQQQPGT